MSKVMLVIALLAAPSALVAQQKKNPLEGTWRVEAGKDVGNGPREVIIRADSSASWGKETVRWRVKGDQISIVIGGEWETYRHKVAKDQLTLSGGDLKKPVILTRTGPATPRPDSVAVPADPDA